MYKLFFILLLSFSFTQEPCEGTCFSEEEVVNMLEALYNLIYDNAEIQYKESQ